MEVLREGRRFSSSWQKVVSVELVSNLSLDAFTALARRYTQPLHVFLCGLVHDPELARDLLQDRFIAAWSAALQCFLSSRRRHTRWTGDWSSDVCSSDLMRATQRPTKLRSGVP